MTAKWMLVLLLACGALASVSSVRAQDVGPSGDDAAGPQDYAASLDSDSDSDTDSTALEARELDDAESKPTASRNRQRVRDRPISVGLLLGYGLNLDSSVTGDLNPFGLGFGVRGGYTLGPVYMGARVAFFLGDSADQPGGAEASFNELTLGLVGGYDVQMSGMILRPELGLGLAVSSAETTVNAPPAPPSSFDRSSEDLYLTLGGTALYYLKRDLMLGAEVQLPMILADPDMVLGLTLMLTGAMAF